MVSIIKKMKKELPYWYLVKSARINGKPRIVWQKYLGPADKIKDFYENNNGALDIKSKSFGSISAMLSIAEELNLKGIISRIVPDNNYKLSIYQHIIMQSICRFNSPLSKKSSIKWFKNSILPLIWKKDFQSPQTIFNQFDKLTNNIENKIPKIEEELFKVLLEKGIKPSVLIWDPTNFFTYIEKGEHLVKKGASKEKRFDKNIINLGLVVSKENIPLMHITYPGNKKESNLITEITELIHLRLMKFNFEMDDIVFVFDKGNNSEINIPIIKKKFNFVGSLRMNQMTHLLDIPLKKFKDLYTNKKGHLIKGYKTKEEIYGEDYSIVITYNEQSAKKQRETTQKAILEISNKLSSIQENFKNKKKGKKSAIKGLSARINDFLHKQYRALFDWKFDEEEQQFSWKINENALEQKKKTYGKNILFSNLNKLSAEEIARTYNSKSIVESDFKVFKDKLIIPIKPFYSRKDPRLKVHVFICVLSMILYRYMQWKLKDMKISENKLNEELKSMRLAFIKQEESDSVKIALEHMTLEQIQIYNSLGLGKFMVN